MKTLQELYKEIIASDELKMQFLEAAKTGGVTEFFKSHGCDASEEDLKLFLNDLKTEEERELSLDDLENVAGGCVGRDLANGIAVTMSAASEYWCMLIDKL